MGNSRKKKKGSERAGRCDTAPVKDLFDRQRHIEELLAARGLLDEAL
jgi:hypothetical protein